MMGWRMQLLFEEDGSSEEVGAEIEKGKRRKSPSAGSVF